MLINYLVCLVFMLMSIAFFTIMERKMLGIFHIRLGPNKVGIFGIVQPFADVLKLFSKNLNFLSKVNELFWNISPIMLLIIYILILMFIPLKTENVKFLFNFIMLIFIISLPIFMILSSSFFSFSKFSILGSKRLICQMLSYEVGFMIILIFLCLFSNLFNMEMLILYLFKFNINKYLLFFFFFIMVLMETSRTPFDFIEGESELLSGFNIEFSSIYFSLFFIYEYGMMLYFCILSSMLFCNFIISFMLIMMFIMIRSSFPRVRYDQMMIIIWKYLYTLLISFIIMMKMF